MNKKISSKTVEGGESRFLNTSMVLPGGRREGFVTGTAPGAAGTLQSVTSHPKESPVGRALTNSTVWGPSCSSRKKSYRARRCFCTEDSEANVGRTAAQVTERRLRARPCARTGEHRPCGWSGLRGTRAPAQKAHASAGEALHKSRALERAVLLLTVDSRGQRRGSGSGSRSGSDPERDSKPGGVMV